MNANKELVACCGLYCGACRSLLKGRCPGCRDNARAKWCKVRTCCIEHGYASCADCAQHADPDACRRFNNIISKAMGLLFNSNRRACVLRIREVGAAQFAEQMAAQKRPSLPRCG
jgi:hypothetical protein